jgi:hypothetical protein
MITHQEERIKVQKIIRLIQMSTHLEEADAAQETTHQLVRSPQHSRNKDKN